MSRLDHLTRTKDGLRICVHALGGTVTRAHIRFGHRARVTPIGAQPSCITIRGARRGLVAVRGRDGFGHPVRTRKRLV